MGAAAQGHELRKTVTVLFCDLAGSTSLGERLDPEALRHVLGRYYAEMRGVLERHGGLVEKFIGDAVVAVFGVPAVHEDDALRAVRAAAEMRGALARLNDELERESGVRIGARFGVNTGDVVAGDLGPGASFVSGDAVNVAARLEQAAGDGEILVGALTRGLLGDAVDVEPVEPLDLHGKARPVEAFRLLGVSPDADAIARRFETSFVGRAAELALLREAFEDVATRARCRLITVVGEPGIGKTRLLGELTSSLGVRARVLTGHCLPYGEGITYWPLAEIVMELGAGDASSALTGHLASDDRGDLVRDLLLGAVGASDRAGLTEEIQWAVRRLFEALAAEQPLVVVLEDLHWAEPTFLQLVEYVAGCSTGAPILLLAAAREELLETRPSWALPRANAQIVRLQTLHADEAEALVVALGGANPLDDRFRTRVVRTGGGNPLFLEQLVALQAENGATDERLPLPATIKALLAARLDRLTTVERDVLERAAVEGVVFHRGVVTALLSPASQHDVGRHLVDAVRRDLIRPSRSAFPDDDGYRFVHVLVHDAVYDSMPKELRAQLHEQLAGRLEERSGESEILGYHLEQAYKLHAELGPPDDATRALGLRAGRLLAHAARRALDRGDLAAAIRLAERATALLPDGIERMRTLHVLWHAVPSQQGPAVSREIERTASATADDALVAWARLLTFFASGGPWDEAKDAATEALPLLERRGSPEALFAALAMLGFVAELDGTLGRARTWYERAVAVAADAGLGCETGYETGMAVGAILLGPDSIDEGERILRQTLERWHDNQWLQFSIGWRLGVVLIRNGRVREGRDLVETAWALAEELGWDEDMESVDFELAAWAERNVAPDRAERLLRRILGSPWWLADPGAIESELASVLCDRGRWEEALPLVDGEPAPESSLQTNVRWLSARARALSHLDGTGDEALGLAREAVDLADGTDRLDLQADARVDLAEVLAGQHRAAEARAVAGDALALYERKGLPAYGRLLDILSGARP